ncbi:acyl-CoA thioesterase [Novispirillum sp. DQ9]|uniref:acyl-CoA thioesterase n=1 Tax=Novispirillum sp. DQ9 TaxID=3398612 RepID=UPI003C7D94A9
MTRKAIPTRDEFSFFRPVQLRWGDFDLLGHLNNVQYVRFYELLVVEFVGAECGVSWSEGPVVPFAAENSCRFIRPINPGPLGPVDGSLDGALRIEHIGTSSVRYAMALFEPGADEAAAAGEWVHVWVDRASNRPVAMPDQARAAYQRHLRT